MFLIQVPIVSAVIFFQLRAIVRFACSIAKSINLYFLVLKESVVGYMCSNIIFESNKLFTGRIIMILLITSFQN
ncbi:hypothetical protein LDENG_00236420, partial [Lucifuga dentata]